MQTRDNRTTGGARGPATRLRLLVGFVVALMLALIVPALVGGGSVARGSTLYDVSGTAGPSQPTGKDAGAATPPPTRPPVPWERTVLQALADAMSWPNDVSEGPGGKLSVQLEIPGQELYRAWIRPFETDAGAGAAFAADMQDLLQAGLRVSPSEFYSYPAYVAVLEQGGQAVERRLVWRADEWIMGVSVRGTTSSAHAFDPQLAARQLLYLAVQEGVPAPPGGIQPPAGLGGTPTAAPTATGCSVRFSDVPSTHWAAPYITQLACDQVVSGYSDGTFRPQNPTTRAQLTKMLALAERWELATPTIATFPDVPPTHVFFAYIETAARMGVIQGYSDGLFRPDSYVTRAQVAKMLVEARGWAVRSNYDIVLCDVPRSHWAWAYIHAAVEYGAFRGYANGCFSPDAIATRAQLAKVLVSSTR